MPWPSEELNKGQTNRVMQLDVGRHGFYCMRTRYFWVRVYKKPFGRVEGLKVNDRETVSLSFSVSLSLSVF